MNTSARTSEAGFSLVDTMIASGLLIVGTLSCATLGMSCTNLQQRTKDYVVAHVIANDTIERMRAAGVENTHTQYSASPATTVQGRQVTVEFPAAAMAGVFGGTMDTTGALAAGFLPVQITVRSGDQNFVFTTFLGER